MALDEPVLPVLPVFTAGDAERADALLASCELSCWFRLVKCALKFSYVELVVFDDADVTGLDCTTFSCGMIPNGLGS